LTAYTALKVLHILLLVAWLGMDIGVFAASFWIRDGRLAPEARLQIGRLAGLLDMGPRSSLILMLPVGLLLMTMGGWGNLPIPLALGVAGLSVVWLWAVWQQYAAVHALAAGHDLGARAFFLRAFRRLDMALRIALAAALLATGATSILSPQAWLDWKLSLFGVLILAGVGIRLVADDFPIALGEIARLGSTPEREARLNTALLRAYPFVLGLWALLIVMTALAVAKPI
jgi:hypothetical protein